MAAGRFTTASDDKYQKALDEAASTKNTDKQAVGANAVAMVQPGLELYPLVARVAAEVTSGLNPVTIYPAGQGGNEDDDDVVSITVHPSTEPQDVSLLNSKLAPALLTVGILTTGADLSTLFYKPASGDIFGRSKRVYYVTLTAIFASGAAEICFAIWLAGSGAPDGRRRRFSFGRALLRASVVPLLTIMAINGFAFTEG